MPVRPPCAQHYASMSHPDLQRLAAVAVVFFLAGAVKGVLGMGLPTVGIALLGLVMPVPQAASLIAVPSFATNVWQAARGGRLRALLARLWPMLLAALAGIALGAPLMEARHARLSALLLGGCLLAYGIAGLAGLHLPRPAPRRERITGVVAGGLTGLLTAATGVFALPAVPFLQALDLPKDELTQALGLYFTASTIGLAAILWRSGALNLGAGWVSAAALVPALLGMAAGQAWRTRFSEQAFRRALFGGLAVLGAWMLVRGV